MARSRRQTFRIRLWTAGSDTNSVFIPFFEAPVSEVTNARISVLMSSSTGAIRFRRWVFYSDDGVTWGDDVAFQDSGWVTTTDAWEWGDQFYSADQSRQHVRYGIYVSNSSGTKSERAVMDVVLDLEE